MNSSVFSNSILKKRVHKEIHECDVPWTTPRYVDENIDPEQLGLARQGGGSAARKAALAAYKEREVAASSTGGSDTLTHFVFSEERGRYFELDSAPTDLKSDARSLSDVATVKPPTEVWDNMAAQAICVLSTHVYRRGHKSAADCLDAYVQKFVDRCFSLIDGPISIVWVEAALHASMATQLHELIARMEARLDHLADMPPQFSVNNMRKERANAGVWTSEQDEAFSEACLTRRPDAVTQRFLQKRPIFKTKGIDATLRQVESLRVCRDQVLCLGPM